MAYYVSGGEVKQDFSLTNDTMYVYSEGIVEGAVLNNGNLYVAGGAVSDVTGTYGNVYVYDGGSAERVELETGTITVSSGGSLDVAIIQNGTIIVQGDNSFVTGLTQNGGELRVSSGAQVTGVVANTGVKVYVASGASVEDSNVATGAFATVSSGAVVDRIQVQDGGYLTVASGATVTNIIWNPLTGNLSIENGATTTFAANQTYTDAYGNTFLATDAAGIYQGVFFDGKYAANWVPHRVDYNSLPDGSVDEKKAYAAEHKNEYRNQAFIEDYKKMYVMSNASALDIQVATGDLHIWNGGIASAVVMSGLAPRVYVSNGGHAEFVVAKDGQMTVYDGGTASDIVILDSDTRVTVENGGTLTNTTVFAGGTMVVKGTVNNTDKYVKAGVDLTITLFNIPLIGTYDFNYSVNLGNSLAGGGTVTEWTGKTYSDSYNSFGWGSRYVYNNTLNVGFATPLHYTYYGGATSAGRDDSALQVESTYFITGVSAGGRTGLTALVSGLLFLLSIIFAPLFIVIPSFARSVMT